MIWMENPRFDSMVKNHIAGENMSIRLHDNMKIIPWSVEKENPNSSIAQNSNYQGQSWQTDEGFRSAAPLVCKLEICLHIYDNDDDYDKIKKNLSRYLLYNTSFDGSQY